MNTYSAVLRRNNWGYSTYHLAYPESDFAPKEFDTVTIKWPDGTVEDVAIVYRLNTVTVNDMGQSYPVTSF